MTESVNPGSAPQAEHADKAANDKELNFRRLERQRDEANQRAEQERQERVRLEERLSALEQQRSTLESDDYDSNEPYIDRKVLKREMAKIKEEFKREAEKEARKVYEEKENKNFMQRLKLDHPDFDQVMTKDALQRLEEVNPDHAQDILSEPDAYKKYRQAYFAIKTAGLHKKPEQPKEPIQDKIDRNLRSPYFVPESIATGPRAQVDFSQQGQKNAYATMQELKKRAVNFGLR